jgi:hypothetical protein
MAGALFLYQQTPAITMLPGLALRLRLHPPSWFRPLRQPRDGDGGGDDDT